MELTRGIETVNALARQQVGFSAIVASILDAGKQLRRRQGAAILARWNPEELAIRRSDRTGTRVDRTIVGTAEGTEVLAREAALRCRKSATVAILIGENEVAAAPLLPEELAALQMGRAVERLVGKECVRRVN